MRALTITAIEHYRKNSHHNNDIDSDILKRRINALISAAGTCYPTIGGVIYKFGSCKIKVIDSEDMHLVTDITWDKDRTAKASHQEVRRLEMYYQRYGLDKTGLRYATPEEIEEFERKYNK